MRIGDEIHIRDGVSPWQRYTIDAFNTLPEQRAWIGLIDAAGARSAAHRSQIIPCRGPLACECRCLVCGRDVCACDA